MRRRYLKGQITILAALVFGIIAILMAVLMESIVHTGVKTKANSAVNLGVQSVFSQYSRPLLERYEVFGGVVENSEELLAMLYSYIGENCKDSRGIYMLGKTFAPFALTLLDLEIQEREYLTDHHGDYFYDEITDYMMYGQFDDELYSMLPELLYASQEKSVNVVNKELKERQKEAAKIDGKVLKLLMYVEGIQTTSSGFRQSFGHLCASDSFVKKICVAGTAFGQTGLDHRGVYDVVSGEYVDLMAQLDELKSDLDWIIMVYNAPLSKGMFVDIGFRNHAGQLASAVEDSLTKTTQALHLIGQIEEDTEKFRNHLTKSRGVLGKYQDQMDPDAATGFLQEFDELRMYENQTAHPLCNLSDMKNKLEICAAQLEEMKNALTALAWIPMDIDSIGAVYGEVDSCKNLCAGYLGHTIKFNYENISLGKGKKLEIIERIQEVFSEGFLTLVVGEKEVSSKEISFSDLSSQVKYSPDPHWNPAIDPEGMYKDYLFNKYISMNFSSFIHPNAQGLLEYEMEYILGDSMSDQRNLESTIKQLINFRFLMNFSHMIFDAARKGKCKATAVTMLGFTGVHGVIKLGQYLLMSAWSYAEAVNDVKILVDGGKVPLKKTSANWHTNLEDIAQGRLSSDKNANPTGLEYIDYLQLLMFLENKRRKIYRVMDMMEVNMIQAGYEHCRMYHYLYAIKGSAVFGYWHKTGEYVQDFAYSY